MTRASAEEIKGAIEMLVNSVYDLRDESGWMNASYQEWVEGVYTELTNWKTVDGYSYKSEENRFEGSKQLRARIRRHLTPRLIELQGEGYHIKAVTDR